ncbi:MAG: hypothetical protein A2W25_15300 [candidate division Zixibacteria bacterium RBG_16_53_22]|nr:MAG: hypothetical protein A2W25_15300 [candidate division Zixibacteria bacterium RBG_16_53_22]
MNWRIVIALLVITFAAGWYVNGLRHEQKADELELAHSAELIAERARNAALTTNLQKERQNAEHALNTLLDRPAPRVRLPICPPGEAHSAGGSALPTAAAERADHRSQEILDDATRRLDSKAAEWSRAIEACRVVMGWALN